MVKWSNPGEIVNTQQNNKYRFYGDIDETDNQMKSKCKPTGKKKKRIWDWARLGGKDEPPGIVQDTEIWPFWQMTYAQT